MRTTPFRFAARSQNRAARLLIQLVIATIMLGLFQDLLSHASVFETVDSTPSWLIALTLFIGGTVGLIISETIRCLVERSNASLEPDSDFLPPL